MLADGLAVLLPLFVPLLFGLPLGWLLRGRTALGAADFLLAPFLGLGALCLVLQNLVYLDVPVARSTPFVWAALGVAWVFFVRARGWRASRAACPRALLLVALAAWALQSAALLRVGPQAWMGRLWEDQFGYTTMAQFFRDERFSTELEAAGQRPWLYRVLRPSRGAFAVQVSLKENRIGQALLQAFPAATLGRDAKPLFGPLIVVSAPLLALGLALLAGRLGLPPPLPALAAALGGLLPALTLLQLENFLSHALVLGFFPAWLVALDELGARPDVPRLAAAALVLSFGVSDYCEMWAAFLALGAVVLGAHGLEQGRLLRAARSWGLLVALSLLLNPFFAPRLFLFSAIATSEGMHASIYPWAQSLEGLARLFLGDLGRAPGAGLAARVADLFGLSACALGVLGLGLLLRRDAARPSRALALGSLALALGALPLRLGGGHPYQFYKTLLTGAPALALGLVALGALARAPLARRAAGAAAWLALALAAAATLDMVWPTGGTRPQPRSNAGLLLDPDVQAALARLEGLRGEALVIGPGPRPLMNAWLAYSARGASVWLANPALGRDRLRQAPAAGTLIDLTAAPADALVFARRDVGAGPPPGAALLWSNPGFELWRPAPGAWVTLFDCEGEPAGPFALGPAPATVRLLAGAPGRVRLDLARVAPGAPAAVEVRLRPAADWRARLTLGDEPAPLELPVPAGWSELRLELVEGPPLELRPGTPRFVAGP